jgi:CRISPR-associated protein Cmr5
MKTRSQTHAGTVYTQVRQILGVPEDIQKQYGTLCHRFPVMVLRNGLAQTLGFLAAKAGVGNDNAHAWLLNHLAQQLLNPQANRTLLLERVHAANLQEYRLLTRKALAVAIWYKRYAESLLDVTAGHEANSTDTAQGG